MSKIRFLIINYCFFVFLAVVLFFLATALDAEGFLLVAFLGFLLASCIDRRNIFTNISKGSSNFSAPARSCMNVWLILDIILVVLITPLKISIKSTNSTMIAIAPPKSKISIAILRSMSMVLTSIFFFNKKMKKDPKPLYDFANANQAEESFLFIDYFLMYFLYNWQFVFFYFGLFLSI